jgi:hypothetical protein
MDAYLVFLVLALCVDLTVWAVDEGCSGVVPF